MYLKGEQDTDYGINRFMLACPSSGPMFLYAIFSGGRNAEQDMMFPVNWLFLDGEPVRIDQELESKQNTNGNINLVYRLDAALLMAISKAKTVGVGLQPSTAAPIFAGFNNMPFADGAAKLPGFLAVCHRSGR